MILAGKTKGKHKGEQGLTLLELVVALALVALLLTLAVPNFRTFIMNNRLTGQTNEFIASLHFARSEATKQGRSVTLCKSSNSTTANPSCSGANWEDGWIIFVDENNSGARNATEILLKGVGPLAGENTLRGNLKVANSLRYTASGSTSNNGTFRVCDSRGTTAARSIVVSIAGRLRVESGATACP